MNFLKNINFLTRLTLNNIKTYGAKPLKGNNQSIEENSIYWYGHATIIINIEGKLILTDPVITKNLGYFKRQVEIPMDITKLKFDYILLSHGHMDHLNFSSLKKLNKNTVIIVPKGYKKLISFLGYKNIHVIYHNEVYKDNNITIKSFEANHDGRRYYLGIDKDSHSFLITRKGKSVFFAGDTAYTENFKDINSDIALMPVGCYKPDRFSKMHCSPEESYKMFKMMNCPLMIPIHYKTFILSLENFNETLNTLKSIGDRKINLLHIGEVSKF